jgi:hypothetical protein
MVYYHTKNPNLGKNWRALEWSMWVYFMVDWNISQPSCIFYGNLIILWYIIWYYFFSFLPRKIWQPWLRISESTLKIIELKKVETKTFFFQPGLFKKVLSVQADKSFEDEV